MAPVKALCTERLTEWYPKFTKLGHLCIEVTGDTDVEFPQLKPYRYCRCFNPHLIIKLKK